MQLIDTFPTNKIKNLSYRVGRVFPFGATIINDAINFSVFSKEATGCTLVLYHHGQREPFVEIPFPEEFRIGNVYTMMVFGINPETTEYGYRFDGPYRPEEGLLFDKSRVLLDPYAKSVSGRSVWGREPNRDDPFPHRGQFIREDYDWENDKPLELKPQDLIIYELHVRSFTVNSDSGVKYKGSYAGLAEKIPYLKELGVNCVELMPIFEFDEFENKREVNGKRLLNYWGYSTVCFFAPKAGFSVEGRFGMEADELKSMIRHLHKNGIQVILDVVFNHTAEGNENGPTISFRGIDNRTYYMLSPDGRYYNFSGCGNTMNCNDPVVRNVVLDLTMNTGGNADAATFVLAWCLGNSNIALRNTLTGAESIMSLRADVNLDGEYDMYDRIPEDIRIWCLTSPVSFSCGNLFPSMLKDAGVPVIGETSGGGSCAIQAMCTADGFCFQISSFRSRLNMLDGTNIDPGVTPDIVIPVDGTVEIELSEETSMKVKNYKPFFDIDNLSNLLKNYKGSK